MSQKTIIKGNIIYMKDIHTVETIEHGYLFIRDGLVEQILSEQEYREKIKLADQKSKSEMVIDYGDRLIIPGMADLHLHASQYAFCGLGMDRELLDWLEKYAFPEEMRFADRDYAKAAYQRFTEDLLHSPTTRACIYTTIHRESSLLLVEMLERAGISGYVGKVNMDRNSPEALTEDTKTALQDTEGFIKEVLEHCKNIKPILTPRFIPSCSDELMKGLAVLQKKYQLPVQSHLSENLSEIELVKELNRTAECYGDAYDMYGLFGGDHSAVMAHCVYSTDDELRLMKKNDVYVAHCANSNYSLSSGIAPIRKYLEAGLKLGLGTDVAGGFSLSMFRAIQDTITVSKLYWRMIDQTAAPLSLKETFYLATMGGGSFFGKVGSFLPGYEADLLILEDYPEKCGKQVSLLERLERICYLADKDTVYAKYVKGKQVL